jgi:ribonuclease HI
MQKSYSAYIVVSFQGIGGYGLVIIDTQQIIIANVSVSYQLSSIMRLYILALIDLLNRCPAGVTIQGYLANGNIVDSIAKGWLDNWHKRQYTKIENPDLWRQVHQLLTTKNITLNLAREKEGSHPNALRQARNLSEESLSVKDPQQDNHGSHVVAEIFENKEVLPNKPQMEHSVCVDASCIGNPGFMEYKCVNTLSGKIIFESQLYEDGTNNIGEFLAIVHALSLNERDKLNWEVIYSDSQVAIGWVEKKLCKTKLEPNEKNKNLINMIERAEKWLVMNAHYKTKVVKWNTIAWGQIPADYGRK